MPLNTLPAPDENPAMQLSANIRKQIHRPNGPTIEMDTFGNEQLAQLQTALQTQDDGIVIVVRCWNKNE